MDCAIDVPTIFAGSLFFLLPKYGDQLIWTYLNADEMDEKNEGPCQD